MTRNEYLRTGDTQDEALKAHHEYYSQYVNTDVLKYVKETIGEGKIIASTDFFFDNIPLMKWDAMEYVLRHRVDQQLIRINGECWSLATSVCIAKAAARQIKEDSEL